jgi:acetyl-CoA carboxylase alpha subunit
MYSRIKDELTKVLNDLSKLDSEKLIEQRIAKFSAMGAFTEA